MAKTITDLYKTEIQSWDSPEFPKDKSIFISAGVGVGKSYFVKNPLYNHAKENNQQILFLIHRTRCVEQFQHELELAGKTDHITVATYQYIGYDLKLDCNIKRGDYKWIVADEAHYFMSDAQFNDGTTNALDYILSQTKAIKIFMSATGDKFVSYCRYKKIKLEIYKRPIKFKYIKSLDFFYRDKDSTYDHIQTKIDECIANGKKAIFFVQDLDRLVEYYKPHKDISVFNCSVHNKDYRALLNEPTNHERLKTLIENETLDCQFLFTTTALDAGVNINNSDLHEIIVDVYDIDSIKQCIGRKRLQSDKDFINLTVRAFGRASIGSKKRISSSAIEIVDMFNKKGAEYYMRLYQNNQDEHKMILDDAVNVKIPNYHKYISHLQEVKRIKEMNGFKKHGYINFVAKQFDFSDFNIIDEDGGDMETQNSLEQYLMSIEGRRLDKDAQNELINKIDLKDGRGRQQRTFSLLNQYLKENEINYQIIPKRNKNERFWEISLYDLS